MKAKRVTNASMVSTMPQTSAYLYDGLLEGLVCLSFGSSSPAVDETAGDSERFFRFLIITNKLQVVSYKCYGLSNQIRVKVEC